MYVLDNNVLSNCFKFVKIGSFPTYWYTLEHLLKNGIVASSREVHRELSDFFTGDNYDNGEIQNWLKMNKNYFHTPTNEECEIVTLIFKNKHFRQLIKRQSLLQGSPEGDPFVIAKAIHEDRIVVTNEKYKVNGAKIPNVCDAFGVKWIDGDVFNKFVNEYFDRNLKNEYYAENEKC